MRKIILSAVAAFFWCSSLAADIRYPFFTIPDSLLKNANVVKRMEQVQFEVVRTDLAFHTQKYAFTILNEKGDAYAGFEEFYDKLSRIISIEGVLYDAMGKEIRRLKAKDVMDLSAVNNISLIDDNRRKVHNFYHKVYPYTVEYEVVFQINNTFHFPAWVPQSFSLLSVQQSSYTFVCPEDYQVRYRAFNYKGKPVESVDKKRKVYTWEVKNVPAIVSEYAAPRWHELTTMVRLAPTDFEIEGYKGKMSSWKEFGKFIYELNKNRDVLPDDLKAKVQQITAGLSTDREKAVALYQFLQQNTRYISIQLGLGGWQPFQASYVAEKGYGDCKALSNYMYSMLKAANIRSLYTLIKAGDRDYYLTEDFPSNQFNHAIVCVPLQKDTLWLECTDQTRPAGYMGDFTGNRKALLIDEEGGTLVTTPRYSIQENLQLRRIQGSISEEGTLQLKANTVYKAMQQDDLFGMISALSQDKVKEVLNNELAFSTYNINSFQYAARKEQIPVVHEDLDITVINFATISGKRMFITPNVMNRSSFQLTPDSTRKYDIVLNFAYRDVDSVSFEVPEGYLPESMPKDVLIRNSFGSYQASVKLEGRLLKYFRIREQFSGRYPAKEFGEFVRFYDAINKADRARVVLKRI